MGFYREEADSISLDIQQFVKEEVEYLFSKVPRMDNVLFFGPNFYQWFERSSMRSFSFCCSCLHCAFHFCYHNDKIFVALQVDFKCDVVLDTGPVTPKVVSVLTDTILSQESQSL